MKLIHRIVGEGKPLVILHGLFGNSDNWQTHAKKLAEYYQVILVDQRNHGHSAWSNEFSYELLAADLLELIQDLGFSNVSILGHSMGGKVAMRFMQLYPEMVEKLIVVDIGVKSYPMHHQEILAGIHAVSASAMDSRSDAENLLLPFVPAIRTRQFLLKNLYWKEKGQLAWRMNYLVLEEKMDEILKALPLEENFTPTLFIRGALSNYILDDDYEILEEVFPDAQFLTIENAGHWVHAEAPDVFMNAVLSFLLR
jgi:pimeloyl-ACP methyl ester carboxylesterase